MLSSPPNLLKQAWEIYKKRFWVFLTIMIVPLFAPSILASILFPARINTGHFGTESFNTLSLGLLVIVGVLVLVSIFIHLWSQIALIYAIKDREGGVEIKEYYRRGWNKVASFFWVYILSNLIIAGGFILFFVPGLIFLIWFIFAPFSLIIEDKKVFQSLSASKEYVKGYWFSMFWRFFVIVILAWLVSWITSFVFSLLGVGNVNKINLYIIYVLFNPIMMIYLFLIYGELKKMRIDNSTHKDFEKKN